MWGGSLVPVLDCCWYSATVGSNLLLVMEFAGCSTTDHQPSQPGSWTSRWRKPTSGSVSGPIGHRIPGRRSFSPQYSSHSTKAVNTIPMRLYDKASLILLANGKRTLDKKLPRTHLPRHGASTSYGGLLHGPRSGADGFARPSRPILQKAGAKAPSGSEYQL